MTNVSTDFFSVDSGLRQGCGSKQGLSPLLFSIFVDDITQLLEEGVRVGDVRVNILMYCDDIVILSDDPREISVS